MTPSPGQPARPELDRAAPSLIERVETFFTWGGFRNWVLVKVTTRDGLYGWGEATVERREDTVRAAVEDLGAMLIGRDALASQENWQILYRHGFWRGGVILNSALAALDQALWDIRGKALGAPVYRLLGGPTRKRVRLYTHVGIYNPERAVEEALAAVEAGYTGVKTGAWASDAALPEHKMLVAYEKRVAAIREAIGPDVDIMIDNHGRSRVDQAVRLLDVLAPLRPFFVEEPTPPDRPEVMAPVTEAGRRLGVTIATGERLFTKWEFAPIIEREMVDVIQPDICHAGGITECLKIAAQAEVHHIMVAPHSPQGPVSTAASAHLGLAIPNFLILEYLPAQPWRDQVLREPWPVADGHLEVPDRPGLGVDFDEDALRANPGRPWPAGGGAWNPDGSVADV